VAWAFYGKGEGAPAGRKTLCLRFPTGVTGERRVASGKERLWVRSPSPARHRRAKGWVVSLRTRRKQANSLRYQPGKGVATRRGNGKGLERARERKGTGYRVRRVEEGWHPDRVEIGHGRATPGRKKEGPVTKTVLGLSLGKSTEVLLALPAGISAVIKGASTGVSLVGLDAVSLGNAGHRLEMAKPRNAFTGVGVLDPAKTYPKLKSTKRGVKK